MAAANVQSALPLPAPAQSLTLMSPSTPEYEITALERDKEHSCMIDTTTQAIDYQALENAHTSGVYSKRPVTIVRGAGATVWDETGRAYLDCAAGYGVANVGHCHPTVVAAIQEQAASLLNCPEYVYNDQRALLQQELAEVLPTGLDRIFLSNSGTEANEAALKLARAATGRPGIVATMRGFHGRTFGALSATW